MDASASQFFDSLGSTLEKSNAVPILAGCATFGSTLAVSTWIQLKFLQVSTSSIRPIPSALGIASVCAASLASHEVALATARRQRNLPGSQAMRPPMEDSLDLFGVCCLDRHALRICTVGLLAFKLLGGRFWAISPSSFTHLGSFARASIPATQQYATPTQRATIERLGRRMGCHTCGSRMLFYTRRNHRFVGDHMPPKAVAKQMEARWFRKLLGRQVSFRFYPQCVNCSNQQGSILASATHQLVKQQTSSWWWKTKSINLAGAGGGKQAHFHGLRFRTSHLAGAAIATVSVGGNVTKKELGNGCRQRYRDLQLQAEKLWSDCQDWLVRLGFF